MNDEDLHKAMAEIAGHIFESNGKDIELLPGWEKSLPFFGWFWRAFDWNRVPLGLQVEEGEPTVVGIMAKNKWYYPEYYCNEKESKVIKTICLSLASEYTEKKVKDLTSYLQNVGKLAAWTPCDREAIDKRTMQNFLNGNYTFIRLKAQ